MRSGSESGKTEWNAAVRTHAAAATARYTVYIRGPWLLLPGILCLYTWTLAATARYTVFIYSMWTLAATAYSHRLQDERAIADV